MKNYNWKLIGTLASIKLFIHLWANTIYGFHQDEFLKVIYLGFFI